MGHNILAPSAAHRWLNCTASIPETLGAIDESSEFADEGTAAHTMASWCLSNKLDAKHYPEKHIHVLNDDGTIRRTFPATDEMKSFVQVYIDAINDRLHEGAVLLVEMALQSGLVSEIYGPSDGTGDATLIAPQFMLVEIHDLKFGKGITVKAAKPCANRNDATGPVVTIDKVDYELNVQLCIYGLGALRLAESLGYNVDDWQIRIVIHQPRLDSMTDADIPVRDLRAWAESVQDKLAEIDEGKTKYMPREDVCRWCPRKPVCAPLAKYVADTIASEFPAVEDMTEYGVGKALDRVALVEQWVKAVKAAAWTALNAGQKIPGWVLAEGRKGDRQWTDPAQVEAIMRDRYRFNRDEMYAPPALITPTEAERRMKKTNPQRWEDLQAFIKRAPARLTLCRQSDGKPAYDLADEMAKV